MNANHGADLHKRVERYELAFDEMQEAHADIRDVLDDRVLFERWKDLGATLGFDAGAMPERRDLGKRDINALHEIQNMNEAWSS